MRIPVPARVVLAQLGVGGVGALVWMAIGGTRDALAALVGGGIAALLSTYVAARVWGLSDPDPKAVLGAFIRAEFGKFVLGAVAFVIAATLFRAEFLAVITTFFAALLVYWVALLWQHD